MVPETVENLVSTVIPVYNRPKMVVGAVESVLAQTRGPIEIIISDDGSTDETSEVIDALAEKHPNVIRTVHGPNRGPGPAREAARQLARGEFIQYLDSDDRLWPRKFEVQVAALREHPECGVAYGRTRLVDADGNVLADPFKWTGRRLESLFPGLLVDRWWCTHTPLYRRSLCDQIGPWSDLRWSQDWEYDGRAGALGTKLAYCDETVSDHRHHAGNRQTGSGAWLSYPEQARFLGALLSYAQQAGVPPQSPEIAQFSRWAFALARQCGAGGDSESARKCFDVAKAAAAPDKKHAAQLSVYRLLAGLVGWTTAGRLSQALDKTRHFARGSGSYQPLKAREQAAGPPTRCC